MTAFSELLGFFSLWIAFLSSDCPQTIGTESYCPKTEVVFTQDGKEFPVKHTNTTIKLDKSAFSIAFIMPQSHEAEHKLYTTQIVADTDNSAFQYMIPGTKIDDTPTLGAGTGMATDRFNAYKELYLIKDGHHNFYYESPLKERGGAKLVETYNHNKIKLRWDISEIYEYRQKPYPISTMIFDTLYLTFFMDKNENKIIDKGEFYNVTLVFQ